MSRNAESTVSHRIHGSYVKYVQDLCRCPECCAANHAYERARASRITPPYVSAAAARAHIVELRAAGVGLKTIAKVAKVSHGSLSKLMYGDRTNGRGPSKRIRRATHEAIMGVTPSAARGTSRVDATATKARIAEMIAAGIPKATIAAELGAAAPQLQIGQRPTVTADTARRVADLHTRWTRGEWAPVRRDCHGNTCPTTPPAPPAKRGGADVSDLYLELADIVDERRAQAEWRQSAACRGRPTWLWFPTKGDRETQAAAQRICRSCIVREQCRSANLDQPAGIFAAMTGDDRRQLRTVDGTPVARPRVSKCGENAGYHQHLSDGEEACDACLLAHAHYVQDNRPSRAKVPA